MSAIPTSSEPQYGGQATNRSFDPNAPELYEEDTIMECDVALPATTASLPGLTSVNFDVQCYIISFLPAADLSALMRTSRYFYNIGLVPLCSHSKKPLNNSEQITSFLMFLRRDSPGISRRGHLIKELRLNLQEYRAPLTRGDFLDTRESSTTLPAPDLWVTDYVLREARNNALQEFFGILDVCPKLERLRIERWYDDLPLMILHNVVARLPALTHLRMPMFPRALWSSSPFTAKLATLPLRSLVLRPGRWHEIPEILTLLAPLAPTLEELDLPVCAWRPLASTASSGGLAAPLAFTRVRRLGIEFPAADADVAPALARAFPALTHLALRGNRNFHLCHTQRARAEEDRLRAAAQRQWAALARSARLENWGAGGGGDAGVGTSAEGTMPWPGLESVAGESACALYTLALPRCVRRVSVGYAAGDPAETDKDMLPAILRDARPACLELRVREAHYRYVPLPKRFGGLKGDGAAGLERLVLTLEGDGIQDYLKVASILIDELQKALPPLRAITHVLLAHSIAHFRAARASMRCVVRALLKGAAARAAAIARAAAPALRWVGVLVSVQNGGPCWLFAWRVVRLQGGDRERDEDAKALWLGEDAEPQVELVPMKEYEAWDVLKEEGMDEFFRTC